ncbi:MAG: A/G-specific adenine glycosylase [Pseudomonadota bacterium]
MTSFAQKLLSWFANHGRHHLPWQIDRDPYKVWLSEIMLQQTQVATVIPYFERFLQRFPDIQSLADADTDDVMALWSGLGYYARARNLQKAARQIVDHHNGKFPQDIDDVTALSGIGQSTAGAILAFCFEQRHPILDGNVKRVLCRQRAVHGYPGETRIARQLWSVADQLTPAERVSDYTQAIMDLGATVCTRRKPLCIACPVADSCEALAAGEVDALPTPKSRKPKPIHEWQMLVFRNHDGKILLQRRPPVGIWGGLWCPPVADHQDVGTDGFSTRQWARDQLGIEIRSERKLDSFTHAFSHFGISVSPVEVSRMCIKPAIRDGQDRIWIEPNGLEDFGLPAPVRRFLSESLPVSGRP